MSLLSSPSFRVDTFNEEDPATYKGFDPQKSTMVDVYKHFGLDKNTQDFTGWGKIIKKKKKEAQT